MEHYSLLQTIFIIPYILFFPGFLISLLFFNIQKIDLTERIAISIALSLSIIPLLIFYGDIIGFHLSSRSVLIEVVLLNITVTIILVIMNWKYIKQNSRNIYYYRQNIKDSPHTSNQNSKLKNKKMPLSVHIISKELFQISLVTYLVLLLAETIKPGFVSYFFNLNLLLAVILCSGIMMVLTYYEESSRTFSQIKNWNWNTVMQYVHQKEKEEKEKSNSTVIKKWDWYYIFGVSLGGGLLVNYKTSDLGSISFVITFATMLIIILLSYLIFTEKG